MVTSHKDIDLTEDEASEVTRFTSFGDAWVERALDQLRARKYREQYLERVDDESSSSSPYRCYSQGRTVYRRRDGGPLTEGDIQSVVANRIGQGHQVTTDGDKIVHCWFVDSSD